MSGRSARQKRSIYRVHYALPPPAPPAPAPLPSMRPDIEKYGEQVAGHQSHEASRYLGILKSNNGTILKPVIKEAQRREVDFYETLSSTDNPDLIQLRKYVAGYHGTKKYTYNGHESNYIILDDLAEGMLEPCIMDVKIGRRTWDPLATREKMESEKAKYAESKRDVAFCIPGFQMYDLESGKLRKYGKEYGKTLNGYTVRDALRIYLNASTRRACRSLVLQLLSELWRVQRWAAHQTAVRLYSASVLLIYDADRLRQCCADPDPLRVTKSRCIPPTPLPSRRKSVSAGEPHSGSFSGQLSPSGPVYRKISSAPTTPMRLAQVSFADPPAVSTPWHEALAQVRRSHSFTHNYDNNVNRAKMDYRTVLDQLSSESGRKPWVTVKIIDFVHAFFNTEEGEVDTNFSEGIDNLVAIFEDFLRETEQDKVEFFV